MNDDLYADLEQSDKDAEIEALAAKCAAFEKQVASLTSDLREVQQHNKSILAEKETLERNMVSLFSTAQREVGRKNKEIAELQSTVAAMRVQQHQQQQHALHGHQQFGHTHVAQLGHQRHDSVGGGGGGGNQRGNY